MGSTRQTEPPLIREWLAFALVLVVAPSWFLPLLLLVATGGTWQSWLFAASVAIPLLLTHAYVTLRGGWRLIGPHAYYDVIRLARKGRTTVFRVAFLLVLLGGLWFVFQKHQGRVRHEALENAEQRINLLAEFNEECAYTWFFLQNLMILVLTPAYVGGAIAEERERHSLDLLLTAALYDREIVIGKLVARLVHLFGFLLAGLPVFSLMQVWGGIDLLLLLGNWANSLLLLLLVGCACILISALASSTTMGVLLSYAVVILPGLCCLGVTRSFPLVMQDARLSGSSPFTVQQVWVLAILYPLVGMMAVALSVAALRERSPPVFPNALPPDVFERFIRDGEEVARRRPEDRPVGSGRTPFPKPIVMSGSEEPIGRRYALPPVSDDALMWKECCTGGRSLLQVSEFLLPTIIVIVLLLYFMIISLANASIPGHPNQPAGLLARAYGPWVSVFHGLYYIGIGAFTLGVGFRAAACIVRERQQQTLDLLLQIPEASGAIVRAKWLGALWKGRFWLILLAVNITLGTLVGVYHPLSSVVMIAGPWPLALFLCSFGLWLSTAARTPVQANLVLATFLLFFGCYLYALRPEFVLPQAAVFGTAWDGLIEPPVAAVGRVLFFNNAGLLVGALFFYWLAVAKFRKSTRA